MFLMESTQQSEGFGHANEYRWGFKEQGIEGFQGFTNQRNLGANV